MKKNQDNLVFQVAWREEWTFSRDRESRPGICKVRPPGTEDSPTHSLCRVRVPGALRGSPFDTYETTEVEVTRCPARQEPHGPERASSYSPPPSPLAIGGAPGDSGYRPNLKSLEAEGPGSGVHSPGHQDPCFSRPPARPARGQLAAAAPFSSRPEYAWRAQYQLPELPAAGTPTAPDAVPSSKTGGLGDERATVASHSPRR